MGVLINTSWAVGPMSSEKNPRPYGGVTYEHGAKPVNRPSNCDSMKCFTKSQVLQVQCQQAPFTSQAISLINKGRKPRELAQWFSKSRWPFLYPHCHRRDFWSHQQNNNLRPNTDLDLFSIDHSLPPVNVPRMGIWLHILISYGIKKI